MDDLASSDLVAVPQTRCGHQGMPVARIRFTAVSDLGDQVVVGERTQGDPDDSDPVGYVFQTKGQDGDIRLAERASGLVCGTEVVVEYVVIAMDRNLARGLSTSRSVRIRPGPPAGGHRSDLPLSVSRSVVRIALRVFAVAPPRGHTECCADRDAHSDPHRARGRHRQRSAHTCSDRCTCTDVES